MNAQNLFVYLATSKTPEVRFYSDTEDEDLYILSIEGRCIPDNPIQFFSPIIEKLKSRVSDKVNNGKIIIDLKLDYINSISVKFFVKILREIEENFDFEKIVVNWYYEDDDTYDLGRDLEFMTGLKFNFVDLDLE